MANGMLLHLGLRHRGVPHGPLLVDRGTAKRLLLVGGCPHGMSHGALLGGCGMAEGPLLGGCGMAESPLLTDCSSGRRSPSGWHHGRTRMPLGPDRSNKNTAQ